ncbi:hypothetical protein KI809_14285 [Geobacter pelophilus]|uniref:Uncharacterized protein n=1 Tax=Geoanaerobacter pelophilus TaxID=60036 RepID=A0AAW4L3K8_9BACT|nr:hypothetical protein [Geoanaerobacter pelophilus]MBT0665473.1 hypothetical protein [Geoanaerobacter pelophilus]
MESHRTSKTRRPLPLALQAAGGTLAACLLLAAAPAMAETVVSGQSDTILRIGRNSEKKLEVPAYEYLRLGILSNDSYGGTLSANFGGWGRVNLDDRSNRDRKSYESDLQYGYISYQAAKNNIVATAGRQFVTEGVASDRLDGIYLRSDIAAGFAASAFAGNPVISEPNYQGGDVIFGGRVSHSMYKYYTVGVSALRSSGETKNNREELGGDFWFHPAKELDVTGRSTFNALTNNWMEHAYAVSLVPNDMFRVSADVSKINYKDYFAGQTTSVFNFSLPGRGIDPNEELTAVGGVVALNPTKELSVSVDMKHYDYKVAQPANYYGAKLAYAKPESYSAGASIHRMDGKQNKLRYTEYRIYTAKEFHNADVSLDLIDVHYDSAVNGVRDAFTATVGGGYKFNEALRLGADIDYSKNPDYDNEVRALVKLTYAFDMKYAGEGRAK